MCAVYAFARRVDDIGDGDAPRARRSCALLDAQARCSRSARRRRRPASDPVLVAARSRWRTRARASRCPLDALERADRGRAHGRDGTTLRDLRRAGRLLPPRRRRDRAAVPGDLRPARARRPTRRGRRAGRRPRRGAAADQHPARRPRGRARTAACTCPAEDLRALRAARRSDARLRPPALRRRSSSGRREPERALGALSRWCASRPSAPAVVRARDALVPLLDRRSAACVLAMAGIYRRLLERIERRPERSRCADACRCRRARRRWVAARGLARGRRVSARRGVARRRRRAGRHRRGARLRRRGRRGDARRGAAAARRRGLLVRARRPADRQRPARVPALLHRLPGAAASGSGATQLVTRPAAPGDPGAAPGHEPARAAARLAAGAAAPRAARWPATRT